MLPHRSSVNGSQFTHGGSGMIGVYNTDQKAAISKLKERGIDNETVYLFFVKECNALKANDSPDVVNGYMPRGYQFGFIYNELNNYRTDAHEICHGAFHLKHTFDATDYLAPERTTDNLMDYTEGQPTTLNHWQWKDIHQPKSVRFKWLQDESGAEAWGEIGTKILCINDESVINAIKHYTHFYLPDGRIVDLEKYTPSGFYTEEDVTPNARGALATIRINGYDQSTIFKTDENTKEHTVTGWGYKIGNSHAMEVLAVNNVLVTNPVGNDAVKVFVSKDEVRIEQNGVVVETLQLSNDCHCTYKQVESECDALLEKYANEPIMNSEVMRRAILANPCILKEDFMIHFAEQSLGKSEWMKDFDLAFGIMINAALFPAEAEILFGMLGEGSAEWIKDLSVPIGRKAVQELTKKAIRYHIKKDAKAFIRGAITQFFISSFCWAIDENSKGRTVTTDSYIEFLSMEDDFNFEYDNQSMDLWTGVLQAGVSNVIDNHLKSGGSMLSQCLLTFSEDYDYTRAISAIYSAYIDQTMPPQKAWSVCGSELLEKAAPAFIDCLWKSALDKAQIDKLDSGIEEEIFRVLMESFERFAVGVTYTGVKTHIVEKTTKTKGE
ncbi:MAG: hypothetical protein E7069_12670 [Bacteroidales bacterium]|jgi:hypothetical protein|nr:hypothetical protein [Bacteroidales bacterium]